MRKTLTFVTFIASAALAGCSSGLLSVHRIDVQQGNALAQEAVEQLEVGMNKEQVRYLLGSPMVTDPFRPQRWDYVYYFKPGNGAPEERRLTVFFQGDRVVRIENPELTRLAKKAS